MLQVLVLLTVDSLSGLGFMMRQQSLVVCNFSNLSCFLFFEIIFLVLVIMETFLAQDNFMKA